MPQLCTPRDVAAQNPRTRAPECGPDDRARRVMARSEEGFAAQEARRSPDAAQHVTGRDVRGMGGGAGVARLISPDPRVNMRAVTDLAGEMTDLVQFYREHAVGSLEMVADQRANVARLNRRDFRGTIREAMERVQARDSAWDAVETDFRRALAMFDAVGAIGGGTGAIVAMATLVRDAITAFDRAQKRALSLGEGLRGDHEAVGVAALELKVVGEVMRDIGMAGAVICGVVLAAPAILPTLAPGVAPTTVGGTLAGAGKAAVVGGTINGSIATLGTALGGAMFDGVSLDEVGDAAGRGMVNGAVSGVSAAITGGAQTHAAGAVAPLVDGAPAVLRGVANGATAAGVGAAAGAMNGATQASLEGATADELAARAAKGALGGAARGAARGL